MALSFDRVTSLAATIEELAIVAATKRILAMDFMLLLLFYCVEYDEVLVDCEWPLAHNSCKSRSPEKTRACDSSDVMIFHHGEDYIS